MKFPELSTGQDIRHIFPGQRSLLMGIIDGGCHTIRYLLQLTILWHRFIYQYYFSDSQNSRAGYYQTIDKNENLSNPCLRHFLCICR